MSIQMRGAEVAKAMKEKLIREREELNAAGVNPCLTIIRVGAKENDLAYERGAKKRMEMIGIECRIAELPEDISQEEFEDGSRDSFVPAASGAARCREDQTDDRPGKGYGWNESCKSCKNIRR